MWFQSLAPWLLAVTMVSQVSGGPTAAPQTAFFVTRHRAFDIPFEINPSSDSAWRPVEGQLFFSTDRGVNWTMYKRVPAEKKRFTVEAPSDGEYWFAIRMVDRSGQARPAQITAPGIRMLVDTKPPVLKLTAQPRDDGQVEVSWELNELNPKPTSLSIVYRPAPTEPWQAVAIDPQAQIQKASGPVQNGEVTFRPKSGLMEIPIRAVVSDAAGNSAVANVVVRMDQRVGSRPAETPVEQTVRKNTVPFPSKENQDTSASDTSADAGPSLTPDSKSDAPVVVDPAIEKQSSPPVASSDAGPTLPTPPPVEPPRMVNSRTFELEYDVTSVGPSGIAQVELWGTRDGGKTWQSFAVDSDKRSPIQVKVKEEGTYGFRIVVTSGAGIGGKPPMAGDPPDLTIGVDLTKPTAHILEAKQGVDSEASQLILSWQADDTMLAARPITLLFSEKSSGPWVPIAAGLENTGRYAWSIDNRTPGRVFLRLEVRDEAGNVATDETSESVVIDQSHPKVRIRSVRPVSQPIRSAMRPR